MIIHRTTRDIARCRRKYGEAWKQYEREVPYLFIPVSPRRRFSQGLEYVRSWQICSTLFREYRPWAVGPWGFSSLVLDARHFLLSYALSSSARHRSLCNQCGIYAVLYELRKPFDVAERPRGLSFLLHTMELVVANRRTAHDDLQVEVNVWIEFSIASTSHDIENRHNYISTFNSNHSLITHSVRRGSGLMIGHIGGCNENV